MNFWRRAAPRVDDPGAAADRFRSKYSSFRKFSGQQQRMPELMAGLQEDLQYVLPRRDVIDGRITSIFGRVSVVVMALEDVTGIRHQALRTALESQQQEIERHAAGIEELARPRLSAWLSEVDARSESSVGAKACMLGEIRNKLGIAVPDGFSLTTEAYRQYVGIPLWKTVRDAARDLRLQRSRRSPPRVRAPRGRGDGPTPAARHRGSDHEAQCGEYSWKKWRISGGAFQRHGRGWRQVFRRTVSQHLERGLSGRSGSRRLQTRQYRRAVLRTGLLFYWLSTGMYEVDNPMSALLLLVIPAKASGIMYTRDPSDLKSKALWITATRGLGLDIASGRMPADLFLVSPFTRGRTRFWSAISSARRKSSYCSEGRGHHPPRIVVRRTGRTPVCKMVTSIRWPNGAPDWREHFHLPQDVEWVMDHDGKIWIVQSRALVNNASARSTPRSKPKVEPQLNGRMHHLSGRTSGPAFLVEEIQNIGQAPAGSVVFIRKPSPEIVEIFPRIAGLVAEWGNPAGHAAALLREFRVPSVFQMTGAFERVVNGEPVSLDAVQSCLYPGIQWPASRIASTVTGTLGRASRRRHHAAAAAVKPPRSFGRQFPSGRMRIRARRSAILPRKRRLRRCSIR